MASDIASTPQDVSKANELESSFQPTAPFDSPSLQSHESVGDSMQQDDNNESVNTNAGLTVTDSIITKDSTSVPDPNPAGPTPIDDNAPGIEPVSDFLSKDASNLSHPTPPPDEPLITGAADVDVEMANADSTAQTPKEAESSPAESTPAQPEQSLVRPRDDEDDVQDEPAAKRSKVEEEAPIEMEISQPAATDAPADEIVEPPTEVVAEVVTEPVVETELPPVLESAADPLVESSTGDVKVEAAQAEADSSEVVDAPVESVTAVVAETPIEAKPEQTSTEETLPEQPAVERTSAVQPSADVAGQTQAEVTAPPAEPPKYSTEPMTAPQRSSLLEKTKNLKKTKNSYPFLKPVDYVALGIPSYPDIIKEPMDLSTMETKLKEGKYASVQDFANDFDLIINNVRRFNGDNHAITQNGFAMEAYFRRVMETVPSSDVQVAPKVEKKRSPSITREKPPRRESRIQAQSTPTAPAPAPASGTAQTEQAFALQADGTPQIRRQSSNRPARAIKPPQNREIPYAKPKRKEHQLELRFCEHVLEQIRSAKYGPSNHPFQYPVDPVALNIPNYHQIIKKPMDMQTMHNKLKNGQYANAAEFKKDFDLIIKNCLTFNPIGNPVRDMGIDLQRQFESLWTEKDKWERRNAPPSNRASSASGDDDSGADDDDDEDDEPEDDKEATIRALQKQLADMQNALSGLGGTKPPKSKKSKSGKDTKKKGGSMSAAPAKSKPAPKPAAKTKKPRQVTYDEKQEISEAVAKMDEKQVGRLTEIITQNCAKYRDMEEMELEIDDLPNDVQLMLLEYVRKIFGNPNKKKARDPSPDDAAALDDDDYEERGGGRGGKRKKHKPMGKKEQQDTIKNIQSKLAEFSQPITSRSESPTNSSFNAANAQADTSGDEESEESEEE